MALSGWNPAQKIACTISAADVPSAQVDFPVLLNITASSGKGNTDLSDVFSKLSSGSLKIAVEDGDTGNQCYVEVERWDDTGASAQLWVQIPSISDSSSTTINFYYDETQADNTTYVGNVGSTPGMAVWNNDYSQVYHLSQSPSGVGSVVDSLGTVDGDSVNMDSANLVDAFIGKGLSLNGVDEHVLFGFGSNITTGTVELSIKASEAPAANDGIFTPYSDVGSVAMALIVRGAGGGVAFYRNNSGESSSLDVADFTAWNHLSFHISPDSEKITNHTSGTSASASDSVSRYLHADSAISRWYDDSRRFPGSIRGVFVSSVVRSDDWLEISYKSRTDNLVTFATTEVGDVGVSGTIGYGGSIDIHRVGEVGISGSIGYGGSIDILNHDTSIVGAIGYGGTISIEQTGQLSISGTIGYGGSIDITQPKPIDIVGVIGYGGTIDIFSHDMTISGTIGYGGVVDIQGIASASISGVIWYGGVITIFGEKSCSLPSYSEKGWWS